jgi:hypothetical protein
MAGGKRLSPRSQDRRLAKSVKVPRPIIVGVLLLIAFVLWMAVIADPAGNLPMPGLGSVLYAAAVIGVAALLAYIDRRRDADGKSYSHKGHRKAAAK